jgi:AAA domain
MSENNGRFKVDADNPDLQLVRIEPVSIGQLILDNPELRPVVIDGILRRGEIANVIASPKVGKSFLAGNLAWCVADGRQWLTHTVTQGRVLVIDNELHAATLANRLDRIARDMQIDATDCDAIDVICLRGQNIDIHHLEMRLAEIPPGTYSLAIVDALYRTLPQGTSENDNAAMMAIYNKLDHYANLWDSAIVVVHHSSKGSQGDKSLTDVGSGAGAISRAADTHIAIRPHEQPELCVLEAVTRSFKSPEPVSIRFDWPLWSAVTTAAEVKRVGQRRDEKTALDDKEADKMLLDAIQGKALSESQLVRTTGMGPSRVSRAIGRAIAAKTITSKSVRRQGRKVAIYTATATATATAESDPCM